MTYTIQYMDAGTHRSISVDTLDNVEALLRTLGGTVYAVVREREPMLVGPRALVEALMTWEVER